MEEDGFSKIGRPCGILTRENKDKWFRLTEHYLIGEDLWDVIDDTSPSTNYSAQLAYKLNGKVIYIISICLSDDDQEYTADITTAKELWNTLRKKYEEKQSSFGKHPQDFSNYKKPADKTIDEAWAKIR